MAGKEVDLAREFELISDVPVPFEVRINCRGTTVEDLVNLRPGNVVALDKPAGETLDVYAGNLLLAAAEVVVVDDRLGIRITDLYANPSGPKGAKA